jgi:hypothetical protein
MAGYGTDQCIGRQFIRARLAPCPSRRAPLNGCSPPHQRRGSRRDGVRRAASWPPSATAIIAEAQPQVPRERAMGCAQPDDRGWRPRARPCWEHGMVAGLTSNHHPNPLPPISALTCRNQGAFFARLCHQYHEPARASAIRLPSSATLNGFVRARTPESSAARSASGCPDISNVLSPG